MVSLKRPINNRVEGHLAWLQVGLTVRSVIQNFVRIQTIEKIPTSVPSFKVALFCWMKSEFNGSKILNSIHIYIYIDSIWKRCYYDFSMFPLFLHSRNKVKVRRLSQDRLHRVSIRCAHLDLFSRLPVCVSDRPIPDTARSQIGKREQHAATRILWVFTRMV